MAQERSKFMAQERAKMQMWKQNETKNMLQEHEMRLAKLHRDSQRKHQLPDQEYQDIVARCGERPVDVHLMA